MTDKPKAEVVSLKAVPKEGKPVEEKKYKVSDEIIKQLTEALEKANKEVSHEVSEAALIVLSAGIHAILDGTVHDAGVFLHHKDSRDISGSMFVLGMSEKTLEDPYRFITLMRHSVKNIEEDLVYPQEELYE